MTTEPKDPHPDELWMAQALALAKRGLYSTSPNPRVGCVLVREGQVVGSGWHARAGGHHAEVMALAEAGSKARGAVAYVTLEPCHHHGRTPPCVDALIEAGLSRVVVAITDEDPRTAGQGVERLREAGIEVITGLLASEAEELNIGFIHRHRTGRPWMRLKLAASLDGRSAGVDGRSQWITGGEARADVHHWRARACAIVTGIETVLADDPSMNARIGDNEQDLLQPTRVILDSHGRLPEHAKIHQIKAPIWVVSTRPSPAWVGGSVQWMQVEADPQGRVSLDVVMGLFREAEFNEVHIEAGPTLAGAFLARGQVDELLLYQAPKLLGNGPSMADLPGIKRLEDALLWERFEVVPMGSDLRFRLRPSGHHTEATG